MKEKIFTQPKKTITISDQDFQREINGKTYFSQACQDLFVLEMLGQKKQGFYLEIGGAHPFESNNTYLLEKALGWSGFSIEFDRSLADTFNRCRNNPCIHADATIFDYMNALQERQSAQQIDYLSVDIDPAENTFRALEQLPLDDYRFSVITYEHDMYVSGEQYMLASRELLSSKGYQLVVKSLNCFGRAFEDWWIDPNVISESIWKKFEAQNVEFSSLF